MLFLQEVHFFAIITFTWAREIILDAIKKLREQKSELFTLAQEVNPRQQSDTLESKVYSGLG